MSIARLYNFSPNTTILSAEVNAELNQLVSEVNLMFKKDASDNITGDVTIAKSNPSLIFGGSETSAKFFKIKESAGVASFQFDNSGYVTLYSIDSVNNRHTFNKLDGTTLFKFDSSGAIFYEDLLGDTTDLISLGSSTVAFKSLFLNNGATDGGAVYFDSDTTAFLKALADGSQLQLGSKFTSYVPSASGGASLGTSTLPFSHLTLSTNIGTSTPVAKRLYSDLITKAWAYTNSAGTLQAGVNLTVSRSGGLGTYQYDYSFRTNMANANYAAIPSLSEETQRGTAQVTSKSTSGFTVMIKDTGTSANYALDHSVIVVGAQ